MPQITAKQKLFTILRIFSLETLNEVYCALINSDQTLPITENVRLTSKKIIKNFMNFFRSCNINFTIITVNNIIVTFETSSKTRPGPHAQLYIGDVLSINIDHVSVLNFGNIISKFSTRVTIIITRKNNSTSKKPWIPVTNFDFFEHDSVIFSSIISILLYVLKTNIAGFCIVLKYSYGSQYTVDSYTNNRHR
jgi:hypothetical protein